MTQKNIWRWTSLKKNKKSVPTEKKFWIISIAVGICLVVLSVCFFSNADKEKKEADLLDTVNYIKVQCSTYTHYNESSESKSLLRAIEGTRQVSKNIAAETENEKTLDDQLLKESAEQLWLTGIVVLDTDGNIVCEYRTNESLLTEIKEYPSPYWINSLNMIILLAVITLPNWILYLDSISINVISAPVERPGMITSLPFSISAVMGSGC